MQENTPVISFETEGPGGMKATNKIKLTFFPPVGYLMEYVEGPLTGSKAMQHYVPMGNRTGVTVTGEYLSAMIPQNQLKAAVLAQLEQAFNEDNVTLQKFE